MKQIPNFPNYFITEGGRVWSHKTNRWLRLFERDKSGHFGVHLGSGGRNKSVHRLVLETYVGKCPDGQVCCHNNGNPQDNRLENLRWGTQKENQSDSIEQGTFAKGEKQWNSKLKESDVRMIIYMWNTGEFLQREIAEIYGVDDTNIGHIVNKKSWKHVWKGQL